MGNKYSGDNRLIDQHDRIMDYVRIAVTDRCNLRCFYCMPEEGIDYIPRDELLTYEELLIIFDVLAGFGVRKVRITGGEPFLRKDLMTFISSLNQHPSKPEIHLTTNGVLTQKHIPNFEKHGIRSVNLSLDTLNEETFLTLTRRNELSQVKDSLDLLLKYHIPTKINMVVMGGLNDSDIIPMAELARNLPIVIRYIEEMPFNGNGVREQNRNFVNHLQILEILRDRFPALVIQRRNATETAQRITVPGFKGSLGIIAAYSRTFCGTCNRIRLTPVGTLKTCLYDQGVFNIKNMLRQGASKEELAMAIKEAVRHKAVDGFEAEAIRAKNRIGESMATIGG